MFSRQKSLVGLDIGTDEVKVVELTRTQDGLELTGFGWGKIPSPEETLDTVRSVLRESGIRCRKVATSVSGRSVVSDTSPCHNWMLTNFLKHCDLRLISTSHLIEMKFALTDSSCLHRF